ncbi:hypothetical protein ACWA1C_12980 [Flectobacillus roseus]
MSLEVLLNKGKGISSSCNLNYFAKYDNLYLMDNHLAAIWCWEHLPQRKKIQIIHIDAHYDLGYSPPGSFLYGDLDLKTINVEELTNYKSDQFIGIPYFLYDNYIHLFNDKFPNRIEKIFFCTQNEGDFAEINGIEFIEFELVELDKYLSTDKDITRVLNLDIDFFFEQDSGKFQIVEDYKINFFINWFEKYNKSFDMITIALSPDFTGSWENSIDMVNKILKPLSIEVVI